MKRGRRNGQEWRNRRGIIVGDLGSELESFFHLLIPLRNISQNCKPAKKSVQDMKMHQVGPRSRGSCSLVGKKDIETNNYSLIGV